MGYKRKSWQEKLADKENLPKILKLEKRFPCYNAVHKMGAEAGDEIVLVNPSEVVEIMKKIPAGKLITIVEICKIIAKKIYLFRTKNGTWIFPRQYLKEQKNGY